MDMDPCRNDMEKEVGEYGLEIEKNCEYYELAWTDKGQVMERGVGMEMADGTTAADAVSAYQFGKNNRKAIRMMDRAK